MADIQSEGHLNSLTLEDFIEHLESPDPKTAFDDERAAREIRSLQSKLDRQRKTIAFFASVIKSGESWTDECERAYQEALSDE